MVCWQPLLTGPNSVDSHIWQAQTLLKATFDMPKCCWQPLLTDPCSAHRHFSQAQTLLTVIFDRPILCWQPLFTGLSSADSHIPQDKTADSYFWQRPAFLTTSADSHFWQEQAMLTATFDRTKLCWQLLLTGPSSADSHIPHDSLCYSYFGRTKLYWLPLLTGPNFAANHCWQRPSSAEKNFSDGHFTFDKIKTAESYFWQSQALMTATFDRTKCLLTGPNFVTDTFWQEQTTSRISYSHTTMSCLLKTQDTNAK